MCCNTIYQIGKQTDTGMHQTSTNSQQQQQQQCSKSNCSFKCKNATELQRSLCSHKNLASFDEKHAHIDYLSLSPSLSLQHTHTCTHTLFRLYMAVIRNGLIFKKTNFIFLIFLWDKFKFKFRLVSKKVVRKIYS